jgi:catechol 2,3-dioxygenase-like lactoylglutathione lyase family enzyme
MLGLRLVKKTVNFDDPSTYHLYFGDHVGSLGSVVTLFEIPGMPKGRRRGCASFCADRGTSGRSSLLEASFKRSRRAPASRLMKTLIPLA